MATTYGQRLIAAVVPRFWKDLTAFQRASGRAYSTIHDWSSGKSNPRLEQLDEIVRLVEKEHGVTLDPLELISAKAPSEHVVVPDDRYPSRAAVIVALQPFFDSDATARVATQANFGARDPGALYWIEALVRAQRDIELERAGARNAEREAGEREFDALADRDEERAANARAKAVEARERKKRGA